ncbi:MAG: NADH-quinone oxidoreductase subunit J [Candidatus Sumerlaeaceae bacterium]
MSLLGVIFYLAATVALVGTGAVLLARNAVNAVLYLLVSLFGVALMMYSLGGSFVAILEVIVYAGAIVVLFLFVIMMLNISKIEQYRDLQPPNRAQLLLPVVLALALVADLGIAVYAAAAGTVAGKSVTVAQIGEVLYRQHYLGVELASLVLLIGLIGALHLGSEAWLAHQKEAKHDGTS